MAWNPNSTQGWKDPGIKGKYDPYYQQPQAQTNVYGGQYKDPGFRAAAANADQWGNKLLSQGSGIASRMQQWINNPSALMASWGAEGWRPGHPDMKGMDELRGNSQKLLDQYAAVRNPQRGGFDVWAGGVGPEAAARQDAMRVGAESYGKDYMGIAGLINDSARNRGSLMGSALGAYGNMQGNLLSAGGQQGQLALGNLSALQSGQEGWNRSKLGEQQWNAQNYNTAMSEAQRQELQRQQQLQQQHSQQDQEMQRWNEFNAQNNAPDARGQFQHYRNLNMAYSPWGWAKQPDVNIRANAGF